MLVEEVIKGNTTDFIKRYSDQHFYIKKVKLGGGEELYVEAIDPLELKDLRRYVETDIPIEEDDLTFNLKG